MINKNMNVKWVDFGKHMIVRDANNNTLLFSSLGYRHPRLTPRDIEDLVHYYEQRRTNYDFGAQQEHHEQSV